MASQRRIILAVVLTLCPIAAQLSGILSPQDSQRIEKSAISALEHFQSTSGDVLAVLSAAKIYSAQQSTLPKKSAICSELQSSLNSNLDELNLYYATAVSMSLLQCEQIAVQDSVLATLRGGAIKDCLASTHEGVTALFALNKAEELNYPSIVDKLVDLLEDEGTFRESSESEIASALNAGLAFSTLALLAPHVDSSSESAEKIRAVVDSIPTLLSTATADGPRLSLGEDNKLSDTASVLAGAFALASAMGEELALSASELTAFAQFFVDSKSARTVADGAAVLQGLAALATNPIFTPISIRVLTKTVSEQSTDVVRVSVTDVYGAAVPDIASVTLTSAAAHGSGSSLPENLPLAQEGAADTYSLDLLAEKPSPAVYILQLSVTPSVTTGPASGIRTAQRSVKVTTTARFGPATLSLASNSKAVSSSNDSTLTADLYPAQLPAIASAGSSQFLTVTVTASSSTGVPLRLHQAFVRFTHAESGLVSIFVARYENAASGRFRLTLDLNDDENFQRVSGSYSIDLLLGDASIENPVVWSLGTIQLALAAPLPKEDVPIYQQPLLHESDTTLKALPLIEHQFRKPEPRPSAFISRAFTAIVLAPFGVMVSLVLPASNTRGLPRRNGTPSIMAIGFHTCIAATLLLFVIFWVRLTMFQTLAFLAPLSMGTFFFGFRTLSALAAARLGAKSKVD